MDNFEVKMNALILLLGRISEMPCPEYELPFKDNVIENITKVIGAAQIIIDCKEDEFLLGVSEDEVMNEMEDILILFTNSDSVEPL